MHRRALPLLALAIGIAAVAPTASHAATVKVDLIPVDNPSMCPSACIPEHSRVRVSDPRGERNNLVVKDIGGEVTIREAKLALRVAPGSFMQDCRATSREITCLSGGSGEETLGAVKTGGGDDKVSIATDLGGGFVDGGPGADTLRGNTSLAGGPGNDRLTVIDASDAIVGNELHGGGGNDVIRARNGLKDTVKCGRGRDRVVTADRTDVLRGCERRPSRKKK